MTATTVGIRELKSQLARYVRHVKAGGTVTITERGKPIVRLVPIATSLDERMQKMIDSGLASWSGRKLKPYTARTKTRGKRTISDLVIENRE